MAIKGSVYVVSHTLSGSVYVVGVHDTKASAMKQANKFVKNLRLRWYVNSDESCHADSIDPDQENEISIVKWAVESYDDKDKGEEEGGSVEEPNSDA